MSDTICANCGGSTTAGCWLCNPDVYAPTLKPYADPTDWKSEALRLREEAWSWMQVAQERLARAEAAEALLEEVAGCCVPSAERWPMKIKATLAKRNGSVKPRETEA